MNIEYFILQMAQTGKAIYELVHHISAEQATWKPDPDSWSILEVVHHLFDEEREDFRTRLDLTLHQAGKPWPEIDPQGWVLARAYNQQDFQATLAGFIREREASLRWLAEIQTPNWDLAYAAPFGLITAGDLFAAWVAHDLLHTRQLVELHWAYHTQRLLPYRVEYAGVW